MRSLSQVFAVAIAFAGSLSVAAQGVKPALQLRTVAGKNTFFIGERIALSLSLTGPNTKKYSIDTAGYDRSGRLNIDTFDVTPANGWSDPLAQYFSQGSIGGGLRGSEPLSSRSVTFKTDLNEHIRFDQAGTYTVTATSHRVGTAREGGFPGEPYLAIVSNPVEVHILPATPDWQAAKLKAILATLAQPVKRTSIGNPAEEQASAVADLRYLDSPAAIEVLASDLREGLDDRQEGLKWAAILGLAGVPDARRDDALHALSRQLDDPAFPVSQSFLTTMTDVEAPPHASAEELRASYDARFLTVWQLVMSELPRKQGTARAATAETLLSNAPGGVSLPLTTQITAIVADTLTTLPIERQMFELEYNWDRLRGQPILPMLQALLHQPPPKHRFLVDSPADLDAVVLRRWFSIDPEGAVRELDLLLASPTAPINARSILLLPGGPQPQFEAGWARELLESNDDSRELILATLLVRFGTGAANPQVESKLDALVGKAPCQSQAAMLAYVAKFNADQAGSLAARAMSSTHTGCYESLFSSIAVYGHGPSLDAVALAGLHNAAPRAAADAALYLQTFGSEAARQPLLARYREWSETWSGQPERVDLSTFSGYPLGTLGANLGAALIANQAWLADPALTAEVLRRCLGQQMCDDLHKLASEAESAKLSVSLTQALDYTRYTIGPYATPSLELFEAKLAQFPMGTKFILSLTPPTNGDQLQLERTVEALFAKYGMTLEKPLARPAATP